jgi:selenide,water dikinase
MEDAALLRPASGPTLAFTVDFITPIVDDPELFGAIAAANALSDVYAMGGDPQVALAVCGFPEDLVSSDTLARIFRGGRDKAAEAGCAIVGGHTVLDPELKYGLSVIGSVPEGRALNQAAARVGDRLVLTKPIGAGIGAQAIKQSRLDAHSEELLTASLLMLNRGAKDAALAAGASAATDVTGFGLLGHLHNMASASNVSVRLDSSRVPLFGFVRTLAEEGLVPGGSKKNLDFVQSSTDFSEDIDDVQRLILSDAQTSGGLLIAIAPDRLTTLLAELETNGTLASAVIGEVTEGQGGRISVVSGA